MANHHSQVNNADFESLTANTTKVQADRITKNIPDGRVSWEPSNSVVFSAAPGQDNSHGLLISVPVEKSDSGIML